MKINKSGIEGIAYEQIFSNGLSLFDLNHDISCKKMFVF